MNNQKIKLSLFCLLLAGCASTDLQNLKAECPHSFTKEKIARGIVIAYCNEIGRNQFGDDVIISNGYKLCGGEICGNYYAVHSFEDKRKETKSDQMNSSNTTDALVNGVIIGEALK